MSQPHTTVTIDRVVLHGVDQHQARAIVESLRSELATVFAGDRGRRQLRTLSSTGIIRLGTLPLGAGTAEARRFGANLARAAGRRMR